MAETMGVSFNSRVLPSTATIRGISTHRQFLRLSYLTFLLPALELPFTFQMLPLTKPSLEAGSESLLSSEPRAPECHYSW